MLEQLAYGKVLLFSKKEDTINLDQDVITIVISTDREKSHKKLKVFLNL